MRMIVPLFHCLFILLDMVSDVGSKPMPTRPSWCIVLHMRMGLNSLKDTIYALCQVKALQPSSEAIVGDNVV